MSGTMIKICGLSRECDIVYVNEARPDYIGFILDFPKSRRNISPARARELRSGLDPAIRAVGVFVDQPEQKVADVAASGAIDVIQLHGGEDEAYIARLRKLTDVPIWKAFKVRTEQDLVNVRNSTADEVLLDNGYGTGEVFDWSLAGDVGRPFLLAGGLTPENIPEAVRRLRPKMIDISSGVETEGLKDRAKILAAVRAVRDADKEV